MRDERILSLSNLQRYILHRLLHQELDQGIYTASFLKESNLSIRACGSCIFEQITQIIHLLPATQFINHFIYEIKQFTYRITHTETSALSKIDYLCIQTRAHGMPLVLLDKVTRQHRSPQIIFIETGQFRHKRLAECCKSYRVMNRRWHIEDAEFNSAKKWMRRLS